MMKKTRKMTKKKKIRVKKIFTLKSTKIALTMKSVRLTAATARAVTIP